MRAAAEVTVGGPQDPQDAPRQRARKEVVDQVTCSCRPYAQHPECEVHPARLKLLDPPRRGASQLVYTGTEFWPLDPRADEVHIEDIAQALSNLCRFTGHTAAFYSVAQHSCHVADALGPCDPALAAWGLLHDASEAYIGDLSRPVKYALVGFGEAYREAEAHLMEVIAERFGLPWPEPPEVKVADDRMVVTERRDLMPRESWTTEWPDVEPFDFTIQPWSPAEARTEFLLRFRVLLSQGGVTW